VSDQSIYDLLWDSRHTFIKNIIGAGETHPLRLHYLLSWFSRHYDIRGPIDHASNADGFPLLPTGVPAFRRMGVGDEFQLLPFYENTNDFLVDLLSNDKPEAVVELGSGYGKNLLELYYRGGPRGIPYYAGEYTESGTAFAQTLAAQTTDFELIPFRFDHNAPDLTRVKESDFVVFFSCHSIEQVAELRTDYFEILTSQADRVLGVHFEPFGFQMPNAVSDVDSVQREFFVGQGWNWNFCEVLRASADRGGIDIKYIAKNVMPNTDPTNPTSLVVWEAAAK